jgi:hypothetical protein
MMPDHEFCDHCPGCRPVIFNAKTGEVFASDSEVMRVVNRIWDTETSYAERKAFIEFTLHNSRSSEHVPLALDVIAKIQKVLP